MLGNTLAFTGSILAIIGAIYNCTGYHRTAGFVWMFSNALLWVTFTGMYIGWWVVDTGLIPTIVMYTVFFGTSVLLWKSYCGKKGEGK